MEDPMVAEAGRDVCLSYVMIDVAYEFDIDKAK